MYCGFACRAEQDSNRTLILDLAPVWPSKDGSLFGHMQSYKATRPWRLHSPVGDLFAFIAFARAEEYIEVGGKEVHNFFIELDWVCCDAHIWSCLKSSALRFDNAWVWSFLRSTQAFSRGFRHYLYFFQWFLQLPSLFIFWKFMFPRGLTSTWLGMLQFMSNKPTELAHSFLFCSCVYFCLYGPFNCISLYQFSRQLFRSLTHFFRSYLCLIGPVNFISLYESLLQPTNYLSNYPSALI